MGAVWYVDLIWGELLPCVIISRLAFCYIIRLGDMTSDTMSYTRCLSGFFFF